MLEPSVSPDQPTVSLPCSPCPPLFHLTCLVTHAEAALTGVTLPCVVCHEPHVRDVAVVPAFGNDDSPTNRARFTDGVNVQMAWPPVLGDCKP